MNIRHVARQPTKIRAHAPKGRRIYAVGDIHGAADLLDEILRRIKKDLSRRPIANRACLVFLGDYIDRGPFSAEVLSRLSQLRLKGIDLVCLKGNHEEMMRRFLADPVASWPRWQRAGGAPTLRSFAIEPPENDAKARDIENAGRELGKALSKPVSSWLNALKLCHREGDYLFVHAGVRPNVALDRQSENDLLWIRADFNNHTGPFGATIVHGHSPNPAPVVRPNRIGIDTMACTSGILTCLVLEGNQQSLLQTHRKGLHKL